MRRFGPDRVVVVDVVLHQQPGQPPSDLRRYPGRARLTVVFAKSQQLLENGRVVVASNRSPNCKREHLPHRLEDRVVTGERHRT